MSELMMVEVFSSIQGEGPYVGYRQLFVRLAGCNACCSYCDTPESRQIPPQAHIQAQAQEDRFVAWPNPVQVQPLAGQINKLLRDMPHHSVSITGGEPLGQPAALAALLPLINGKIYLETNGTLPAALTQVIHAVDIVSMDIKLPSIAGKSFWNEHRSFLQIASRKEVFVKLVVGQNTTVEEYKTALQLIADVNPAIPLILQPVTHAVWGPSAAAIAKFQETALHYLQQVRVIPQTHKFIGVR